MSLTWKSISHAFASSFTAIAKGAEYLAEGIAKVDTPAVQQKVESLTALIPGIGAQGVAIEQISFAGLGMIAAGLHIGGAAFEKNLLDNGSDQAAIDEIKSLIAKYPSIVTDVEAVFGKKPVPPTPVLSSVPASVSGVPATSVNTMTEPEIVPAASV